MLALSLQSLGLSRRLVCANLTRTARDFFAFPMLFLPGHCQLGAFDIFSSKKGQDAVQQRRRSRNDCH